MLDILEVKAKYQYCQVWSHTELKNWERAAGEEKRKLSGNEISTAADSRDKIKFTERNIVLLRSLSPGSRSQKL